MGYKEKINLKLFTFENNAFVQQAIIDDYQEISFSHNLYEAGDFTITINYNIPNALKFERGMWVQFDNDPYMFGEILTVSDSIGSDGKGSQIRTITGKDARYIFKRRVIRNLNTAENWSMTNKGEIVMRYLIQDQCGIGAEQKRRLPIVNDIPAYRDERRTLQETIGKLYSVAEAYSNLYEVLVTIATQTDVGWRIRFENGTMTLEFYKGEDKSNLVRFDTNYDSLANGEFIDSAESYANVVYVGGKGSGADRDIYEGQKLKDEEYLLLSEEGTGVLNIDEYENKLIINGTEPDGLDRYEAWDNQSDMNTLAEYESESYSMLLQYAQTLQVSGQGLVKCPYEFKKEYFVGDTITLAFSGKSAVVQILSVTEHWAWGDYGLEFSFGKPQNDLAKQLQLMLKQIQKASNKSSTTSSVKWYTIPSDTEMVSGDVIYNTIGFIGDVGEGATFKLYLDNQSTGAKTYHVYLKQLGGAGKLRLTTGKAGASNLELDSGTYVTIIYVDENGNVLKTI